MSKINLLLLYGGKSGEHEISLISAASVLAYLDTNKYHVIPIGMSKEGCFYQNDYQDLLAFRDSLPVKTPRSRPLASLLNEGRLAVDADVVFPMVHGPLYEDGCLQGLLELASVAYVGTDVMSSAIMMDKDMAKRLICTDGIRSARYHVLSWHSSTLERQEFCQRVMAELGWPLFVKPCSLGSSVGIHKVKNSSELVWAIRDALRYDETILVEEYISGREIELAVLEGKSPLATPRVSVAGEVCTTHVDGFYSYAAKYLDTEQLELHIPAKLDGKIAQQLQKLAGDIFTRLKCRGMARVDFFVSEQTGNIYFSEINALPGFTPMSMYPKLWQASGLPYPDLLDELISLAMTRQRCRQQLVTSYS
jgi:D-alanine-D-alanine ligase